MAFYISFQINLFDKFISFKGFLIMVEQAKYVFLLYMLYAVEILCFIKTNPRISF